MHARQIGPLNLGAKLYVRKKSQIVFVGAGYRVLLAATDSNQRPVNGPSLLLGCVTFRGSYSDRIPIAAILRGDKYPVAGSPLAGSPLGLAKS
jgi:hypothetical protein